MGAEVFIIAEAGVNHNGSLVTAKKMIDCAHEAGADAVKFQTFSADRMVSRNAGKAEYQKRNTSPGESQYEMIKKLEFDAEVHRQLIAHCRQKGIMFLSAPFDLESISLLDDLGLEVLKIPSGEITNLPYLRRIGSLKKKLILSTGMSGLSEVKAALGIIVAAGTPKDRITVLHCTTEYPTPYEDVNLNAMLTMKKALRVRVGYSDHTSGIEVAVAAAALGAEMIEKHFTLDRTMEGPDQRASLEPAELAVMVSSIRNISRALGDGVKKPSPLELKNIIVARKSIVASKAILKGEKFHESNITVKRPGNGISPMKWDEVLGRTAKKPFNGDDLIEL
jgi:N,N'-diacetyllegionaminate synthase